MAHRTPGDFPEVVRGVGTIASSRSTSVTPRYSRFRRRLALGVLAILLAIALTVSLVAVLGDGGGDAAPDGAVAGARLPDVPEPGPVLTALASRAPVPDPDVLDAVLTPLLADPALGAGVSAQVVDVATGQVLFAQDAEEPATPASTVKLLTAVAALSTLGPDDTLETTVVAGSAPGEVVLIGGGDPTLSRTDPSQTYPGAATVAELAAEVQAAMPAGTEVSRVVVDTSLFSGPEIAAGWGPGDAPSGYAAPITAAAVDGARVAPGEAARSGQPGLDAGAALAQALGAPGATVVLGQAPQDAEVLGRVESAPIARLVEQALSQSDNVLAEALGRHVAIARDLPPTFQGAARGVTEALTDAGLDTGGVRLVDASGLSAANEVPVAVLVDVLAGAADASLPGAYVVLSGLAVAGYDGTLADRGDDDPVTVPGAVRAKTGTLLGVHALAGTVVTADGRLVTFAVLADGTPGDGPAAEQALDDVAVALARCGCP